MAGRVAAAVVFAGIAVLALGVADGQGPPPAAGHSRTLQRVVRGLVASGAPGAVGVVRTPTGTRRAAAGLGRLRPAERMRATDRFRIASVTKTFVAAVVLQLAAEKRLRLDDPVARSLPGLLPNGRTVTLRQLLGHTSGLFDYDDDEAWVRSRIAKPAREWSPRELVAVATSHPPLFRPGTRWSYSNTNYVLLGLVVQAVSRRPLAVELRKRIFEPLRLSATSYPTGTAIPGPFAHGYIGSASYRRIPKGRLLDVSSRLSPSAWGAGQIVSNAHDLTRFFGALLRGRVVPAEQLALMKRDTMFANYGLGLRMANTRCGTAFGHEGDVPGYRTVVWAMPNGRRAAAVMLNVDTTRVSWDALDSAARTALCSG